MNYELSSIKYVYKHYLKLRIFWLLVKMDILPLHEHKSAQAILFLVVSV